jgi:hypothetical protein
LQNYGFVYFNLKTIESLHKNTIIQIDTGKKNLEIFY